MDDMFSLTATHTTTSRRVATAATPLTLPARPRRFSVLARLLGGTLDARLARGAAPGSGRLLAARAEHLVSPSARRDLADAWDQVLVRATEHALVDPRIPVARGDVLDARGDIVALATALRAPSPVTPADVARAQVLLTDGSGPLYTPGADLRLHLALLVADLTDRG